MVAVFSAISGLSAYYSTETVGNDLRSALQLWLFSHLGPFTGFIFSTLNIQVGIAVITALLILPIFFSRKLLFKVTSVVGSALWFLPDIGPVAAGI